MAEITDLQQNNDPAKLEPVHAEQPQENDGRWTARLVLFLRIMAGVSMLKGLYHWSAVIVDKDNKPRWKPSALAEVAPQDVARHFAPLPAADEWVIPNG